MKQLLLTLTYLLLMATSPQLAWGELCTQWSKSDKLGTLRSDQLLEASGVVASTNFFKRLYHINDRGNEPSLFISTIKGKRIKQIGLNRISAIDFEDLTMASCSDEAYIVIGDIGDNHRRRNSISIHLVKEKEKFRRSVAVAKSIKLSYPNGRHDAEGIASHPDGNIYLLTKSRTLSSIYRINREIWQQHFKACQTDHSVSIQNSSGSNQLEHIANIDLVALSAGKRIAHLGGHYGSDDAQEKGELATSFDISPDGKNFLIMTYDSIIEFNFDLSVDTIPSTAALKKGRDFHYIDFKRLVHQESVAYLPSGRSIIYTTESRNGIHAPIMGIHCLK
ncbi:MAG: hypothetical protein HN353_01845 [Bdellovibrionales bacterium]|jgi:hypothetical protein|nr:hypothetical protein [Bdellovibrionales bacterium]MBT3525376.1 hypothetical protein [Bdellovibrionales bacterium]MBT7670463.1 hypothetical protein [Bdellovibrionales bacterium]MBT7765986.1 hypothetical protein [Bdellovibrionales bacterium]